MSDLPTNETEPTAELNPKGVIEPTATQVLAARKFLSVSYSNQYAQAVDEIAHLIAASEAAAVEKAGREHQWGFTCTHHTDKQRTATLKDCPVCVRHSLAVAGDDAAEFRELAIRLQSDLAASRETIEQMLQTLKQANSYFALRNLGATADDVRGKIMFSIGVAAAALAAHQPSVKVKQT